MSATARASPPPLSAPPAPRWRLVLVVLLALIALLPCLARADFLVTNQGLGLPGLASIQRYSETGALLWSTPLDSPGTVGGLTLSADGATAVVALETAAGGALLLLDAASGAVTGQITAAAPGQPFAGPLSLATAADGSYWLGQAGMGATPRGTLLHLGADFALLGTAALPPGAGTAPLLGLALGPAGEPIIACCDLAGGALYQVDPAELAAAPMALLPDLAGALPRGLGRRGDTLYLAAGAAAPGQDRILRSRRDAAGNWGAWTTLIAGDAGADRGFAPLAFDTAGNILVGNLWADSISRFSPDGLLLDTPVTGLNRPVGLYYIPMPEPGSLALLVVGVVVLLLWRRHA